MKVSRKLIAVVIIVIVLAVSIVPIVRHFQNKNQGTTLPQINNAWLNQQLINWYPSSFGCITFAGMFQRASYWHIVATYDPIQVELADLGMLYSASAGPIRIDLNYQPWLQGDTQTQNEMTQLIDNFTSHGHPLIIADSASESYRQYPLPWTEFKQQWISRVTTLASLYHPEYYIVVKEPGWYYPMISDRFTNPLVYNATQWIDLTQNLVQAVKNVSPSTQVGVAVAAFDLYNGSQPKGGGLSFNVQYLHGVESIKNLSFIGFDMYGEPDFYGTMKFLSTYGNGGKSVWIPEAWSSTNPFNASSASLDAKWMKVLYYFALHINATEVMPFYSDQFASYSLNATEPTVPSEIISLYQDRTPIFYEYRNLSQNYSLA